MRGRFAEAIEPAIQCAAPSNAPIGNARVGRAGRPRRSAAPVGGIDRAGSRSQPAVRDTRSDCGIVREP